jgi:hypothetical protein
LDKSNRPANYYSPDFVEHITQAVSTRGEKAPEGWMTKTGLAERLGFAPQTIQRIADRQRQAHEEWFKKYLDETNKRELHYSPELVEHITQAVSMREKPPEGWMTNAGLANKLDATFEAIKRIADKQQETHSGWFKEYLDNGNHLIIHYSPELVEYITQVVSTWEKAPEGWMTNYALAQSLGVGGEMIRNIADQQERKRPDWVKEYLNTSNRLADHYSPELVKYITQEISSRGEQAPEGWMTNRGLATKLGVTFHLVKNIADRQRQAHSEWFREYLDKTNGSALHYSPDLVKHIAQAVSARGEKAPEGWMTNLGLAKRLGVDFQTVKKTVDQHKKENPDWIKEYLDKSNRPANYYSPEFVEYITREIKSRKSTF